MTATTVPPRVPSAPLKNTLAWVNFAGGDEEFTRHKHPAALAFVEDVWEGKLLLRWYGAVNWSKQSIMRADPEKTPP
eukprot:6068468-Prymnesium_polylepis.1